ncbi:MAG TPA: hypothetical protein V6D33_09060 [Cyanophyceae cyanobacterium]
MPQPQIDAKKLTTGGIAISLSWVLSKTLPAKLQFLIPVLDAIVVVLEAKTERS